MTTEDKKLIDEVSPDDTEDGVEAYQPPSVVESARFETIASAQAYDPESIDCL